MDFISLNLSSLRYFIDAVELGSLTLAAEKNHLTRPGVSQAIRRIEDVLGFNLIEHSKNKLELTVKGADFFQRAKKGLNIFERVLCEKMENAQTLRVACSATIAEFVLIPTMRSPKVIGDQIQIRIGTTSKVRQLVEDGDSDLGLVIDEGQNLRLESTLLRSGRFALLSKTGAITEPLITTEERPEVTELRKNLRKVRTQNASHIQVESWAISKKWPMP